jgi:hypothetical protein
LISTFLALAILVSGQSYYAAGSCGGYSTSYSSACPPPFTGYAIPQANLYQAPTAVLADPFWEYAVKDRYEAELRTRHLETIVAQLAESNAGMQALMAQRQPMAQSYITQPQQQQMPQQQIQLPPQSPYYGSQQQQPMQPQTSSYIGDVGVGPEPLINALQAGTPDQIFQAYRCTECHSPGTAAQMGGGNVVTGNSPPDMKLKVVQALASGHMPPPGYARMPRPQFDILFGWAMQQTQVQQQIQAPRY